jgi:hypothetical protein
MYLINNKIKLMDKFLENKFQKMSSTDIYKQATVLYADIVGFTKFSASVSP